MPDRRHPRLHYAFNSLLGEILLWILILLMFLWALSVVMTYGVADSISTTPYDGQLATKVDGLAKLVGREGGRVRVSLPEAAQTLLRSDGQDRIYFQIVDAQGTLLAGDKELPIAEMPESTDLDHVFFRDETLGEDDVRVAYRFIFPLEGKPPVLVQVGETLKKRQHLTASIVSGVIIPQFVIVPLAVLMVYLGLTHGITPLQRLQHELRGRQPSDLSPISLQGIPEEIRPLLEALNDVMARLDDNLNIQRRFVADAAHQLKTPLTGLRTQTELALQETDPALVRRGLQQVAISVENLSRMTQQLLALARTEAAGGGRHFERLDLVAQARTVAGAWADRALERRIDLAFEAAEDDLWVQGNPLLVQEMLTNLIDNAIKYTPSGGQVTVRAQLEGGYCCIDFEDSGIGIAPDDRTRVFERFYRVLGTETDGSGLGLAIVKEVVDLHGGYARIDTPPSGCGTLVHVCLPRATGA